MRPQIVIILAFVLSILNSTTMLAQHNGGGSGPPPPGSQRGPELPIDQGLEMILILGALLGIYVIIRKVKANNAVR